jgi:hypothetical protein
MTNKTTLAVLDVPDELPQIADDIAGIKQLVLAIQAAACGQRSGRSRNRCPRRHHHRPHRCARASDRPVARGAAGRSLTRGSPVARMTGAGSSLPRWSWR